MVCAAEISPELPPAAGRSLARHQSAGALRESGFLIGGIAIPVRAQVHDHDGTAVRHGPLISSFSIFFCASLAMSVPGSIWMTVSQSARAAAMSPLARRR